MKQAAIAPERLRIIRRYYSDGLKQYMLATGFDPDKRFEETQNAHQKDSKSTSA